MRIQNLAGKFFQEMCSCVKKSIFPITIGITLLHIALSVWSIGDWYTPILALRPFRTSLKWLNTDLSWLYHYHTWLKTCQSIVSHWIHERVVLCHNVIIIILDAFLLYSECRYVIRGEPQISQSSYNFITVQNLSQGGERQISDSRYPTN